ncbi:hypothetical protein SAMN03097699_0515 [Flavobacteriaceae bacterium MAR_2010_188]|nr:hypothetical protein SAMN03097699_0515 [Flavobacteriaceae bacterium MAR_2010_188]
MKNIKNTLLGILFIAMMMPSLWAQNIPQGMKYQAVARDLSGVVIADQEVVLKIKLQSNLQSPVIHFTETHTIKTNQFGLFSLVIGEGVVIKGKFNEIPWSTEDIWMEISIKDNGKTEFTTISNSKLLAVPYAFHAATASQLVSSDFPDVNGNAPIGVPSQNWSLFGNRASNSDKDKLGTTDYVDLVLITNDLDRLRITKDGDINIANNLNVGKNVDIGNDLHVGNDTYLDNNVEMNIDGGTTINHGNFTVEDMSSTLLTGTITVDGATDLKSTLNVDDLTDLNNGLNVNNASATALSGTLNVEGATTINNILDVSSAVTLNSVDGTTNISGITNINNILNSSADVNLNTVGGSTNIQGPTTINNTSALKGQVTINANVGGGDASYDAYPLRIEGSQQGIAIKLSAAIPDNSSNFVTFFNSGGGAVGRIEGETLAEHTSSPQFIFDEAILIATEIKAGVNFGLSFIPVTTGGLVVSTGPCGACIGMAAADLALATANLIAFNIFETSNLGVTYESGSADYAEWLERANPNEQIIAGDIVGVTGGKISKYTANAKQFMVISTKPAMLGNMPEKGREKSFEKVAFMGQIPVKVRGLVMVGDYILPSGNNDGIGIAISPDEITADQYTKIVGVSWSASVMNNGVSLINMAIGLNRNDIAQLVAKQESRISKLEQKFEALASKLNGEEKDKIATPKAAIVQVKKPTKYEIAVANMPAELSDDIMDEAMLLIKERYESEGLKIADHPGLDKLLNDPTFRAQTIRQTQVTYKETYKNYLEIIRNQK